jgi:hypothetical protein
MDVLFRVMNEAFFEQRKETGNVMPVLNYLSTKPWEYTWDWRYGSTILNLGIRWLRTVIFAPLLLTLRQSTPSTHYIGCRVGPQTGPDIRKRENLLPLAEFWFPFFGRPPCSLVAIHTKISRLPFVCYVYKIWSEIFMLWKAISRKFRYQELPR